MSSSCLDDCLGPTSFCVNILSPDCFKFQELKNGQLNVCLQTSACRLTCKVIPCTYDTTLTIPNPCGGADISCSGSVTVYKTVVCGSINILVNALVYPVDPVDLVSVPPLGPPGVCASKTQFQLDPSNTPGNPTVPIYVCTTYSLPVDQTICVSCSPLSVCPEHLLSSITVTSLSVAIAGNCLSSVPNLMSVAAEIAFSSC